MASTTPCRSHWVKVKSTATRTRRRGRSAAAVGVAQKLHPDDLGGEPTKGKSLGGAQQQLEVHAVGIEKGTAEDRGVDDHDL